MKLKERIQHGGAAGYILLWFLGIPIPRVASLFPPAELLLVEASLASRPTWKAAFRYTVEGLTQR
jgi:hypothetical protein